MRYALFLLPLVLMACNHEQKPKVQSASTTTSYQPLKKYGIEALYTGDFEPLEYNEEKESYANKITLSIDSLKGDNLYGHSIVAGNTRLFRGKFTHKGTNYEVEAEEPGGAKYDGRFSLIIDGKKRIITGTWTAYDTTLDVRKRSFRLEEKTFRYDPSFALPETLVGGIIYGSIDNESEQGEVITEDILKWNASEQKLSAQDVENMYKGDLEILRNSIYARHGYTFRNRRMRFIFDAVPWYMPVSTDVTASLTTLEKENIALLKRYEKHAEQYYDAFGR